MQYQSGETETSLLQEIFQEAEMPCSSPGCQCHNCQSRRSSSRALIQELGLELDSEEEYEFSKAFDVLKSFAKRTYHAAKPYIVAATIAKRLIDPSMDTTSQMKDYATVIEQDRRRRTQEGIESAQSASKTNIKQKPPDPEMSLLQEIFMEAEYELSNPNLLSYEDDIDEHTKNARPSTKEKHQFGQARKRRDRGGEKGDARRDLPRKKPDNWKGPWPPKK